jgi:hypothetical protein
VGIPQRLERESTYHKIFIDNVNCAKKATEVAFLSSNNIAGEDCSKSER